MEQNPTHSFSTSDHLLNAKQYAIHVGASDRSIKRWLAAGELPGAQMIDGAWAIPSTTVRVKGLNSSDDDDDVMFGNVTDMTGKAAMKMPKPAEMSAFLEALNAANAGTRQTMEDRLAEENIYIPVERAAPLLGLSVHEVKSNREEYGVVMKGGKLVVPKAQLRYLDQTGEVKQLGK